MDQHRAALIAQEESAQNADCFFLAVHADEPKERVFLRQGEQATHDGIGQKDQLPNVFGPEGIQNGARPGGRICRRMPPRALE